MGGWIATDEASPNFEDMIMNMRKGQSFAKKEFGVQSKVAVMVDSFGHSAANAALFHDMGIEATFIMRVDDTVRKAITKNHTQTFLM